MALWGSGGMLPRKIFENSYTVMIILVLFEQFCLLPLISRSPNITHFIRTFRFMRA